MYRTHLTAELGGVPPKHQLKDLFKTALFFYQVANEELLADSLIQGGLALIDQGKLTEAQQCFEDANQLEKWRDIYGTVVLANLAYICAMKGNMLMAKQYIDDYYMQYSRSEEQKTPSYYDHDEHHKMNLAQ
jgi:outer membrane protein assembly factor BamD (BamD/ComL family)